MPSRRLTLARLSGLALLRNACHLAPRSPQVRPAALCTHTPCGGCSVPASCLPPFLVSSTHTAFCCQATEALGLALAEFGGPAACEEAVQALRRAVELQPHLGHEKHMYLGQLVAGQEGIAHLRRGVELLQAESDRR